MTTFRFMSVEEWGGRWARPPVGEKLLDPECFIHHTAGNPMHEVDAAVAFRSLNEYAINSKGYSFLDYDIMVHENTVTDTITIGEGRGQWLSAATRDRNEQGEAVCAMGYFHTGHSLTEHPSPAMLEGVARGISWGMDKGWISKTAKIMPHRDNPAHPGATGCPGNLFIPKIESVIIPRVKQLQKVDTMIPLSDCVVGDIHPYRLIDTRALNMTPLKPGQTFYVAFKDRSRKVAFVNITPVGQGQPGHGSVNSNSTSAVNFSATNPVNPNCVPVKLHDGHLVYKNGPTPCHLIVDVYAEG